MNECSSVGQVIDIRLELVNRVKLGERAALCQLHLRFRTVVVELMDCPLCEGGNVPSAHQESTCPFRERLADGLKQLRVLPLIQEFEMLWTTKKLKIEG